MSARQESVLQKRVGQAAESLQANMLGAPTETAEIPARLWALVVLTGAGAGLTSGLLMKLLRLVQHISFHYAAGDFLAGVRGTSGMHRLWVLCLGGVITGVSLYLFKRFAGNAGTDVTGVIWRREGTLDALPTVVKSLISIVAVGMGAAVGREAALKDVGATVASKIGDWMHLTAGQKRLLIACGAGAGMAAAYNVPLGGALFTVEVLLGTISIASVLAALVTSFTAVAVSWLMLPNAPTFAVPALTLSPSLLLWALLAGPVVGAASALYVRVIGWAERGRPKGWLAVVMPVVVFAVLGLVSMRFPEVLGNGKNVVQEAFGSQLGPAMLCWLLVLRPLATALCLKAGTPGGLFTPTMTFGALLGGLLGEAWSLVAPGVAKDSYAIVGAGAMLAAASQGPLSSAVFMLELTNHTDALIVPLLIAVAGATIVARQIEVHSIYSVRA